MGLPQVPGAPGLTLLPGSHLWSLKPPRRGRSQPQPKALPHRLMCSQRAGCPPGSRRVLGQLLPILALRAAKGAESSEPCRGLADTRGLGQPGLPPGSSGDLLGRDRTGTGDGTGTPEGAAPGGRPHSRRRAGGGGGRKDGDRAASGAGEGAAKFCTCREARLLSAPGTTFCPRAPATEASRQSFPKLQRSRLPPERVVLCPVPVPPPGP